MSESDETKDANGSTEPAPPEYVKIGDLPREQQVPALLCHLSHVSGCMTLLLSVLFGILFGAAGHQWIGVILGAVTGLAVGLLLSSVMVGISFILLCPRPVRNRTYHCASAFVWLYILAVPTLSVLLTIALSIALQALADWIGQGS